MKLSEVKKAIPEQLEYGQKLFRRVLTDLTTVAPGKFVTVNREHGNYQEVKAENKEWRLRVALDRAPLSVRVLVFMKPSGFEVHHPTAPGEPKLSEVDTVKLKEAFYKTRDLIRDTLMHWKTGPEAQGHYIWSHFANFPDEDNPTYEVTLTIL